MEFFDVVVYPNPTHDFVNIHINKIPWTETTIKVLNQIGQVVIMKTIDSQNEMINLSGYASGLYLILITENNSNYCKQFIINKQ